MQVPPDLSDREIARYYTFTEKERELINRRRRGSNRLGFAVQLALLRFPGRTLMEVKAVPESFFGTLKGECVERSCFQTRREARQNIFEYVECFYNRVRRHSSLGYVSPVAYEQVRC